MKIVKEYYCHSLFADDPHEWIETSEEDFNENVVEFRNLYRKVNHYPKVNNFLYQCIGNNAYDYLVKYVEVE